MSEEIEPAQSGGPGARYDWDAVRLSFCEGVMVADEQGLRWLNLREVSELHSVPYKRCREYAAREGWNEQRAAFQGQLEHARRAERSQSAAREAADLDSKALIAAKAGIQLTLQRLQELTEAASARAKARQPGGNPDGLTEWVEPLDTRELATLARAAGEWRALGAAALGLPSLVTATEISGPGGAPIDLRTELMFDDPYDSRVTGILVSMERAGLLPDAGAEEGDSGGVDSEVPGG